MYRAAVVLMGCLCIHSPLCFPRNLVGGSVRVKEAIYQWLFIPVSKITPTRAIYARVWAGLNLAHARKFPSRFSPPDLSELHIISGKTLQHTFYPLTRTLGAGLTMAIKMVPSKSKATRICNYPNSIPLRVDI